MAIAARDLVAEALRGDEDTARSTELTLPMDALTLQVEGFGRVQLPVTPAKARKLIGLSQPARFGRGEETLTDPDVRDTWEVPKNLVRASWDPAILRDALTTVKQNLGLPNASQLTPDFHSLLVYEPNQFFLKHQDTEKSDDMIGTLVVTLPSSYQGGELMVGQGEERKAYHKPSRALSLVAFYADCQHEVLKVQSGYRITLTYNLLLSGDTTPRAEGDEGDEGVIAEITGLLRDHFTTPAMHPWGSQASSPPSRLVYLLDHEYTPRALKWTRLKGADARRVPRLRQAAERAGYEAILGLADVKTTHDAWSNDEDDYYRDSYYYDEDEEPEYEDEAPEYTINDLIDTEVTVTHWTGPDGTRLEETSLPVSEAEVCASTPNGDLVPYESEYEGYMGNWGNTLDRWYHRGAIVLWPREQAFANRAETSPGWALDEIIAMASSGDAAGARDAAATLESVWNDLASAYRSSSLVGAPGPAGLSGLLGKALRAADAVADPEVAAMLLKPFRIQDLTEHYTASFGTVAARYGQDWAVELVQDWFGPVRSGSSWLDFGLGGGQAGWVAEWLSPVCSGLRSAASDEVAQRLLELSWDCVRADTRAGLASSSIRYRDQKMGELGQPLTALLTAAATLETTGMASVMAGYVKNLEGDPVTVLELACLRAASDLSRTGFQDLAADCAARLRDRLDRPGRKPGDWSLALPPGGCSCVLCQDLSAFLSSGDQRVFEWPLAKERRRHIHGRIDAAELPVTHATRRQGRPYTLVLTKTDDLFAGERKARERDEADLKWLENTRLAGIPRGGDHGEGD